MEYISRVSMLQPIQLSEMTRKLTGMGKPGTDQKQKRKRLLPASTDLKREHKRMSLLVRSYSARIPKP